MIVKCETCDCDLERNNSQIKASKTGLFFCNRECKSSWHVKKNEKYRDDNIGKVSFKCPICNKTEMVSKHIAKTRKTCSIECDAERRRFEGNSKIHCDYCGETFSKKNSKITENNFCTRECMENWNADKKNDRLEKECIMCGKVFYVIKSYDSAKMCSLKCKHKYTSVLSRTNEKIAEQLRQNGLNSVANQKTSGTKPENITEECLTRMNVRFETQLKMYDKFIVDFYLPEYDTVLEVYGDYWHMNPEIYGNDLKMPNDYQMKQSKKDKSRKAYLQKCGHKFVYLWEKDIYKDIEKEVIDKIISNK